MLLKSVPSWLWSMVFGWLLLCTALCMALWLGGPRHPAPMVSINEPFKALSREGLPDLQYVQAEDGQSLAYRAYVPAGTAKGCVVLVHGSSATSVSMHAVARALVTAGHVVYALDMRGHGASGPKGHIDHVGQLESDLHAFVKAVQVPRPSTLLGFSSGGGFVLRVAGSLQQGDFDSYLLVSPFISQDAPNQRPGSGGWVHVGVPRIVALTALNAVGIRWFNHLPVTAFALNAEARSHLTSTYDFNLASNFRPPANYLATMQRVRRPLSVLAGAEDEAFVSAALQGMVRDAGQAWPVEILPGLGHIPMILVPSALQAVVRHVAHLQGGAAGQDGMLRDPLAH